MINPITPEEVKLVIPDFIISIVNNLIKENFDGHEATFTQEEILDRIDYEDVGYTRREIFDHNFLDFEDLYKNVGWKVLYDKPGYNEDYKAYFKFTKK